LFLPRPLASRRSGATVLFRRKETRRECAGEKREMFGAQESFSKGWPSLARSLIYRASSSSFPFIKIFHGL